MAGNRQASSGMHAMVKCSSARQPHIPLRTVSASTLRQATTLLPVPAAVAARQAAAPPQAQTTTSAGARNHHRAWSLNKTKPHPPPCYPYLRSWRRPWRQHLHRHKSEVQRSAAVAPGQRAAHGFVAARGVSDRFEGHKRRTRNARRTHRTLHLEMFFGWVGE